MKYDKTLYNLIRTNRKARERYYKNRTVAFILQQKHPLLKDIKLDKLTEYIGEALTLDRQWRKIMQENEDLRGRDYDYKKIAEQKAQIELGYQSGYYSDVKTLNKIQ